MINVQAHIFQFIHIRFFLKVKYFFGASFALFLSLSPVSHASDNITKEVYSAINARQPGYGITDYPENIEEHIPKSYAMVLLAEIHRTQNGLYPELKSLASSAGNWLLESFDLNKDGVSGWGVPVAWDAYGDNSENPANTEYTISTAIVVDALLTWMEKDPDAPRAKIMDVVQAALLPFLNQQMRTVRGLSPYSFMPQDRKYNTYNPAAYLAGQLQRFSRYIHDEKISQKLSAVADDIVEELLNKANINNETGTLYWFYSEEEEITNDIAHAAYIVHGLATYTEYRGTLSSRISLKDAFRHLGEFYLAEENELGGWPYFESKVDRPARSYGLGMAMSLLCSHNDYADLGLQMRDSLSQYQADDGTILKYPPSFELFEPIHINEYHNYLYRGLVACDVYSKQSHSQARVIELSSSPLPALENTTNLKAAQLGAKSSSPLKTLEADFNPDSFQEIELFHNVHSDHSWWIYREIPTDVLKIVHEHSGVRTKYVFSPGSDSKPIFRAAASHGSRLDFVYFDNQKQINLLHSAVALGKTVKPARSDVQLPSFEDPAGGTYEMIPKVFVFKHHADLTSIAAGPLLLEFHKGSIVNKDRQKKCTQIVEAVHNGNGFGALCRDMNATEIDQVYSLRSTGSVILPNYDGGTPVFNLKLESNQLSFQSVTDEQSLQGLLEWEFSNAMQSGWMQYGISNREGRVPWDQIYYLNGLLDFLDLSENHKGMQVLIEPFKENLIHRINQESSFIFQHWLRGLYKTKAFSVDRSEEYFAVQTSRLLLLLNRLEVNSFVGGIPEMFFDVHQTVHCLSGHIDIVSRDPQPVGWMFRDAPYLKWPKGSTFYFDGLNVPYNHQNEWAYSVLETPRSVSCPENTYTAEKILEFFMMRETFAGTLPAHGVWQYWWGQAYEGWSAKDKVSKNYPEYRGDHITAWISFRSIDVMSILSNIKNLPETVQNNLISSTKGLLANGKLYPFVNHSLKVLGEPVILSPLEAMKYARAGASWEFQNTAWAMLYFSDIFQKSKSVE